MATDTKFEGEIVKIDKQLLSELTVNQKGFVGGKTLPDFLQYLDKQGISLGATITVLSKESFDLSLKIKVKDQEITISNKIASNLFVKLLR
jgi:DtxR family Mn-dependent transcriptional regulator